MRFVRSWASRWPRPFIGGAGAGLLLTSPAALFRAITGVPPASLWTNGLPDLVGSNDLVAVGTPGIQQPVAGLVDSPLTRSAFITHPSRAGA